MIIGAMSSHYFENFQRHSTLNRSIFRIKSLDVGVVNAVRRVIMSYLPTLAIGFDPYNKDANDITFHKNTTALHNEILGHRISMIPLHIRVDSPTVYRFEINLSNITQETIVVTTDHIKCFVETSPEEYSELPESSTRTIFPVDSVTADPIIITKLKPREELHVTFKTRKGFGYQNACFSPVSLCTYTFVIDEQKAEEALEAKLKEIGEDQERQENYRKVFSTLDKHRYFHTNQYGEPTLYDFQIEIENGSDPIDLVRSAFRWLEDKLAILKPTIQKTADDFYLLTFSDAEHTIGNLLQTLFFREYVRKTKEVTYIGYNVPHPLEKILIMKIKVKEGIEVGALLETAFQVFKQYIESVRKDWESFTNDISRTSEIHMATPLPIDQKPKAKRTRGVVDEAPALPPSPLTKAKAPRKKKTEEADADAPPPSPPKAKAPRKKKVVEDDAVEAQPAEEVTDAPPPSPPKAKAPRKKKVAEDDAVEAQPAEEVTDAPPPSPPKAKAPRKKKTTELANPV